jgi:hypothetical protein
MMAHYLLFLAKYTQDWGGYHYEKGTPRGIAMHVKRDDLDLEVCLLIWFGASVTVSVGDDAYRYWREANPIFVHERDLLAALPPMLRHTSSRHGIWTFDDRAVTPELLVELGQRVVEGKSARRDESELPPPPKPEYSQNIKDYFGLPGARPR